MNAQSGEMTFFAHHLCADLSLSSLCCNLPFWKCPTSQLLEKCLRRRGFVKKKNKRKGSNWRLMTSPPKIESVYFLISRQLHRPIAVFYLVLSALDHIHPPPSVHVSSFLFFFSILRVAFHSLAIGIETLIVWKFFQLAALDWWENSP